MAKQQRQVRTVRLKTMLWSRGEFNRWLPVWSSLSFLVCPGIKNSPLKSNGCKEFPKQQNTFQSCDMYPIWCTWSKEHWLSERGNWVGVWDGRDCCQQSWAWGNMAALPCYSSATNANECAGPTRKSTLKHTHAFLQESHLILFHVGALFVSALNKLPHWNRKWRENSRNTPLTLIGLFSTDQCETLKRGLLPYFYCIFTYVFSDKMGGIVQNTTFRKLL